MRTCAALSRFSRSLKNSARRFSRIELPRPSRGRLLCKTRLVRESLTLVVALALANSLSLSFSPIPSTETISRVGGRYTILDKEPEPDREK